MNTGHMNINMPIINTSSSSTSSSSTSRLCVIVPGFGDPYWDHKVSILRSNIESLEKSHAFTSIHVIVVQYTPLTDRQLPPDLLSKVDVKYKQGIVGEFIKEFAIPTNNFKAKYDYVMIIMDDIQLNNDINWTNVMKWKKDLNINVMSPSLTHDSKHVYTYMLSTGTNCHIIISPVCELFCYFLDMKSYERWYTFLDDKENPWLWGMDLLLEKQFGLKAGLLQIYTMQHWYQTQSMEYHGIKSSNGLIHNAATDFHKYLAKFGETHSCLVETLKAQQYLVLSCPN